MMKVSTHDKTTGKVHEVKGAIRQKAGEIANNPNLAADGKAEKIAGKVQNIVGRIEKAVESKRIAIEPEGRERSKEHDAISVGTDGRTDRRDSAQGFAGGDRRCGCA